MAAGTERVEGFGQVSRTVGTVFRYVLLAATLVGIVALGVLLVYVGIDTFQPQSADPGWHLTYLLTLVVPTVAVAVYLRSRTEHGFGTGVTAMGVPVVGGLFGAGVTIVFVDLVPPLAWFAYLLAVTLPLGVVVTADRVVELPTGARIGAAVVLLAGSLAVLPGFVSSLRVVPTPGVILFVSLGLPVALFVGRLVRARWTHRRAGWIAGGAVVLSTAVVTFVGPLVGVGPVPAVVLWLTTAVPGAAYVSDVLHRDGVLGGERPTQESEAPAPDWYGLLLPAIIVGGLAVGALLTGAIGFGGPQSSLNWQFLTSTTVTDPATAGIYPALVGSILLMIVVVLAAFPVGVGAAVYLEEYARDGPVTRLVQVNISNLAGVPSVVYGLLGLGVFIRYGGSPPGTVIVGGLTLALLILPIVIIAAQEALRSVPDSLREASYGMGATRWQTVKNVVLPRAFPGILTGTILAIGRAVGETAPLLVIGAANVADVPTDLSSRVAALPLQIYVWATTFADPAFFDRVIPAGVIVLLVILLTMNSVAIVLRNRYQTEG